MPSSSSRRTRRRKKHARNSDADRKHLPLATLAALVDVERHGAAIREAAADWVESSFGPSDLGPRSI